MNSGCRLHALLVVAALLICCVPTLRSDEVKLPDLIMGTILDQTLYTRYMGEWSVHVEFERLDRASGAAPVGSTWGFSNGFSETQQILRWRIVDKNIWFSSRALLDSCETMRLPLTDLDIVDTKEKKRFGELYKTRYPDPETRFEKSHYFNIYLARSIAWRIWLERGEWPEPEQPHKPITEAYGDFLPTSATSGLLFEARKDWCKVYKFEFKWRKAHETSSYPSWDTDAVPSVFAEKQIAPTEIIDTPDRNLLKLAFKRPFMVIPSGTSYFFLTLDGRLFVAAKPKEGRRKAEVFWYNDDNPVFALITDANTGRQFAFTKPAPKKENEKPLCFEISGTKVESFPIAPERIKALEAMTPMKRARDLTQFLIDLKKIELKPTEKK